MSQENVEIVRSFYRAGEPSVFFDHFAEDIEVDASAGKVLPDHPEFLHGKDAALEYYRHYYGAWDNYTVEPIEVRRVDHDRVLTTDVQRGRGRGSGAPFEVHATVITTFRDGRIVKLQFFNSREEALEAAGLEE